MSVGIAITDGTKVISREGPLPTPFHTLNTELEEPLKGVVPLFALPITEGCPDTLQLWPRHPKR